MDRLWKVVRGALAAFTLEAVLVSMAWGVAPPQEDMCDGHAIGGVTLNPDAQFGNAQGDGQGE